MIERQLQIKGKTIKVKQDLSFSHAGTVWDGALVLAYYLQDNQPIAEQYLAKKRVLELGSGTGFLGLACTAFSPKQMILTDLPEYVSLIDNNIQLNLDSEHKNRINECQISAQTLSWGDIEAIDRIGVIDTVIGSELAYDKANTTKLIETLSLLYKKNDKLKIIISYQKYENPDKNLALRFSQQFKYQQFLQVPYGEMNSTYRDDYIGILYIK